MTAERFVDAVIYVFALIGVCFVLSWLSRNGPWWWGFALSAVPFVIILARAFST